MPWRSGSLAEGRRNRQKPVTRRIHLAASEAIELYANDGVVCIKQRMPVTITHLRRAPRRVVVIAGTIGGAGKLEFTLIGDTVNVAVRVEQYTKTTGDPILLTRDCLDALKGRSPELIDRGSHALKGKSAAVQLFGLGQETYAPSWPH